MGRLPLAVVFIFLGWMSSVATASPVSGDWYLAQDHAAAAQSELPASLTQVRVAVLDSGVDGGHPAIAASIAAARSFVGDDPLTDSNGHGTFVAGEIVALATAAAANTTRPSPVQLLIAKITDDTGSISLSAEARAIYWAVENGARVINLSLGGLRDPNHPASDTYSPVEAAAVRYAIGHRVVVVAAVGNGDEAPSEPWTYASWPAALPHVIGVSAIAPDGSVPDWSNRDPRFNELAAPGSEIVSAFPRSLTALTPTCFDQGYSDCGPSDYQPAEGTSFAAPQVSAAAALLLSAEPQLTPDQVAWLLERTTDDANPRTGCSACALGRDPLTGWGTLDVGKAVAALSGPIPQASMYEPTNDAGYQARLLTAPQATLTADLDYWENPLDVYRVHLDRGEQLWVRLTAQSGGVTLALWRPGTAHVPVAAPALLRERLIAATGTLPTKRLHYHAIRTGWYYLEIALQAKTNAAYTLAFATVH